MGGGLELRVDKLCKAKHHCSLKILVMLERTPHLQQRSKSVSFRCLEEAQQGGRMETTRIRLSISVANLLWRIHQDLGLDRHAVLVDLRGSRFRLV